MKKYIYFSKIIPPKQKEIERNFEGEEPNEFNFRDIILVNIHNKP